MAPLERRSATFSSGRVGVKEAVRQLATKMRLASFGGLIQLYHESALRDLGWFRSFSERRPTDREGRPLPFMSYGAIDFLNRTVRSEFNVFEFGSGYSTLWWASRARRVVSCEHDQAWYQQMSELVPNNVKLLYREHDDSGSYAQSIVDEGEFFDVVVIDGRERLACADASLPFLSVGGVLVWDDTDRERYKSGILSLRESGFRQIDFVGIGPMLTAMKCTSIFYRSANLLGI
jgi:hypothetical protein